MPPETVDDILPAPRSLGEHADNVILASMEARRQQLLRELHDLCLLEARYRVAVQMKLPVADFVLGERG